MIVQVVIVCDFGDVNGGAAKVAIGSAVALANAGVSVTYVCAFGPVSAQLKHERIAVHCFDFGSVWDQHNPLAAASQGIWFGRARSALEGIIATMNADQTVVHFHQWTKAFS